jgi:hypothetical protein
VTIDVAALAQLLQEKAEHHGSFEAAATHGSAALEPLKYAPKPELNRREQCGNTTKLFCRNTTTGGTDVVLFDTFEEFSVDPWTYEWVINEYGDCVSKDGKEFFPFFLRYSCLFKDVQFLDGNPLNCRRENIDVI